MSRLKVLVLCHDVVGKNMAGPGIRYRYISQTLGKKFDVTLGVFSKDNTDSESVVVVDPDSSSFKSYFDATDCIFAQWLSDSMIEYALKKGKIIIFDLYAPVPIEYLASLEFSDSKVNKRKNIEFQNIINMYKKYMRTGEFFTCSNERQRDFWIGYITANGVLNPKTFLEARFLDKFALCPMGIPNEAPPKGDLLLRKAVPEISNKDFVLLWTGGIWDWFDAKLIIRAMSQLADSSIKLVFLGTKHPNPKVSEMKESIEARQAAKELGLLNKTVFFLDGWVDYDKRSYYFQDADAAIYADKESLETRFSHRTRVLDHIWTELPTICTDGDSFSEIIRSKKLGLVTERTPEAFAARISKLASDKKLYKELKNNLRVHKKEFTWDSTLHPLVEYLDSLDVDKVSGRIKKSSTGFQVKRKNMQSRAKTAAKILLGRS